MNAAMINDQWNIKVKGDLLLIGRNATYTGSIDDVPNAVVYDLTTNPISEVTGLICAERSFNAGTVYCTGVSWHPTENIVTLSVSDNGIRTKVFTYDEFNVFTEIDNYISPEPTQNSMNNCCFSPDGLELIYTGATSPYGFRFTADQATGNTALTLTPLTAFTNSRLCDYSEDSLIMAFGETDLQVIDTSGGTEVDFSPKPSSSILSITFT
jgi:WD40 repeat protein